MTPTTNPERETKRLHVFKAASARHRQGVIIGVLILFARKAPQHGAEAGF